MKSFYVTTLLFTATSGYHFYPVFLPQYPRFTFGAPLLPIYGGNNPFGIESAANTVFDAPTRFGAVCNGSMEIETKDGQRLTIVGSLPQTSILFNTIKVHGCGCYSVHSLKNGRGLRRLIFPLSQRVTKDDVGFPRIRSIFRIPC